MKKMKKQEKKSENCTTPVGTMTITTKPSSPKQASPP